MLKAAQRPLVWIDCEMTGLDHTRDVIMEICCIITDGNLRQVGPTFHRTVHHPKSVLDKMNAWCVAQHGASGLTQRCLDAPPSVTEHAVGAELLSHLQHYLEPQAAMLAGNSVHMDRLFMLARMPQPLDHLHYRLLDVSSIYETAVRFAPQRVAAKPPKAKLHTAESDIRESIGELEFYRELFFK